MTPSLIHAEANVIRLRPMLPVLAAFAAMALATLADPAASAESTVQTLTYQAGEPGTEFHASFAWTVVGVTAQGRFIDGTPWITVEPGARLVAVSPMSRRRITGGGLAVVTDGTVINPRMMKRWDPQTLEAVGDGLQQFDGRRIFLTPPTSQKSVDASFNFDSNVTVVDPSTGQMPPVELLPGDVVVTASSEWRPDGSPSWAGGGKLPHVGPFRRTAINRFGTLTVLADPLPRGQPHFRPPMQWPAGEEASRPAPIPRSDVIADESAILHAVQQPTVGLDRLLEGPTFHDGSGILYQSSHAQHALSADPDRQGSIVYGGNLAKAVFRPMLLAATDRTADPALRTLLRDRLIQWGIDSYGATMYLGVTRAGAGQRAAEMKPWIMLAGWWLDRPEMRNPYQAIRERYAGTAVAALGDVAIGRLLFHDDHVARQVQGGIGLGAPFHQLWGPGLANRVVGAGLAPAAAIVGAASLTGQFGRLDISGAVPHWSIHARKPANYYGCSLVVESGPGSGATVYRVIEVGDVNGAIGQFIKVDQPWRHGLPGPGSTVRMFPFRNGDFVPGLVSDVGRWYYSTNGQEGNVAVDSFSPAANAYARISYQSLVAPHAALKRLADATGNVDYLRGSTWHWLSEAIGGDGRDLVTGNLYGTTPVAERISNQCWNAYAQSGMSLQARTVVEDWIAGTAPPAGGGTEFGSIDRSRIAGTTIEPPGLDPAPCEVDLWAPVGVHRVRTDPAHEEEVGFFGTVHSAMRIGFIAPSTGVVEVAVRPLSAGMFPVLSASAGCTLEMPLDLAVASRTNPMQPIRVLFDAARESPYLILVGSRQPGVVIKAEITISLWDGPPDGDVDGSAGDDGESGDP